VAVAIASISISVAAGLIGGTSAAAAEPLPGKVTQFPISTPDSGASSGRIGTTQTALGPLLAILAAQAEIARADLDQIYADSFIGSTDDFIVKYRPTVDLLSCRLTPCSR